MLSRNEVNQAAALCTISYNISLAVYYLLVVVKGWKEKRVEQVERYLHAAPIVAGLGTSFTALGLKLFNGAGWICWIAPGLPNHPERHNPSFGVFRLAFLYADAWAIILFLAVVMLVIYIHVLRQEKSLDKYVSSSFASKKRKQSRKIRNQAFLYVGAMYLTWVFGSVSLLLACSTVQGVLFVIGSEFSPLSFSSASPILLDLPSYAICRINAPARDHYPVRNVLSAPRDVQPTGVYVSSDQPILREAIPFCFGDSVYDLFDRGKILLFITPSEQHGKKERPTKGHRQGSHDGDQRNCGIRNQEEYHSEFYRERGCRR